MLKCKDCDQFVDVYRNMVMLKNKIWQSICDNKHDVICSDCIEIRLKRKINLKDLKTRIRNGKKEMIPCNVFYYLYKSYVWYCNLQLKK